MTKYLVGAKERGGPCCRLSRQLLWWLRSERNQVLQRVGRLCLPTPGLCGHAHNCVVNNNGLESTNGKIKDMVTQRHLMQLLDFLRAIMGWITSKSVILDSTNVNYKPFALVHSMTTKCWTEAYRWSKDASNQVRIRAADKIYVVVRRHVGGHLNDARASSLIDKFLNFSFQIGRASCRERVLMSV